MISHIAYLSENIVRGQYWALSPIYSRILCVASTYEPPRPPCRHVRGPMRHHPSGACDCRGDDATTRHASAGGFLHDGYMREQTGTHLRDRLKSGLSQATSDPDAGTVAELAERIKALRAAHTIEKLHQRRPATLCIVAEEPVTSRIRRRSEPAVTAVERSAEPESAALPTPVPPADTGVSAAPDEPPAQPVAPAVLQLPFAARSQPALGQHAAPRPEAGGTADEPVLSPFSVTVHKSRVTSV